MGRLKYSQILFTLYLLRCLRLCYKIRLYIFYFCKPVHIFETTKTSKEAQKLPQWDITLVFYAFMYSNFATIGMLGMWFITCDKLISTKKLKAYNICPNMVNFRFFFFFSSQPHVLYCKIYFNIFFLLNLIRSLYKFVLN